MLQGDPSSLPPRMEESTRLRILKRREPVIVADSQNGEYRPAPSCSLWTTGRSTNDSTGGAGAFFLLASSSMRLPIGSLEGTPRYFYASLREVLFDTFLERRSGHCPDDLVDELPALEEEEGRDPHDHVLLRDARVRVGIQFHERHLARVFLGEVLDDRGDRFARRTPLGPEIDDHVGVLLDDLLEIGIGDRDWLVCHVIHL